MTKQLSWAFWPDKYKPFVTKLSPRHEWLPGMLMATRFEKMGLIKRSKDEMGCTQWGLTDAAIKLLEGETITT